MLYNQYDHYIGKSIELYGEYCEHEISLFSRLVKPTDTVWEIGSNTGSQSTALSKMVPQGKFVGFEPQIELYKIFTSNLTLNNCENAMPLCFALGDEDGIIDLPGMNYHQPNNFGALTLLGEKHASKDKVELRKIDSLTWLPPPNFIKMDVEGMEVNVLNGGKKVIAEHMPIMYVENDRVEHSEKLIETLWDFGYKLFWHITTYYNQNNYFNNKSNIYGNTASYNMLCVPPGNPMQIQHHQITDKTKHPLKI